MSVIGTHFHSILVLFGRSLDAVWSHFLDAFWTYWTPLKCYFVGKQYFWIHFWTLYKRLLCVIWTHFRLCFGAFWTQFCGFWTHFEPFERQICAILSVNNILEYLNAYCVLLGHILDAILWSYFCFSFEHFERILDTLESIYALFYRPFNRLKVSFFKIVFLPTVRRRTQWIMVFILLC